MAGVTVEESQPCPHLGVAAVELLIALFIASVSSALPIAHS